MIFKMKLESVVALVAFVLVSVSSENGCEMVIDAGAMYCPCADVPSSLSGVEKVTLQCCSANRGLDLSRLYGSAIVSTIGGCCVWGGHELQFGNGTTECKVV